MAEEAKAEGNRCFRAGEFAEAVRHFTEALRQAPGDTIALGNRAAAFDKLGEHTRAVADANAALKSDETYLKGYFRKATALLALGRFVEAEAAATAGLRHQPKNAQLRELHARAQAGAAKAAAAARARAAAAQRAEDSDEYDEEGDEEDEDDEGEEEGEEEEEEEDDDDDRAAASAAPPVDPEVAAERAKGAGNDQYKRGDYAAAVRLYTEAVRLAPANPTYLLNRAAAALMLERADDALSDCTKALELDPSLVKAHVRSAKALTQLGRVSDARRQLEGASALPTADASLAAELRQLTELDTMLRNAKDALGQEGGAPAREALRLYTLLAERCPVAPTIAGLQMEVS